MTTEDVIYNAIVDECDRIEGYPAKRYSNINYEHNLAKRLAKLAANAVNTIAVINKMTKCTLCGEPNPQYTLGNVESPHPVCGDSRGCQVRMIGNKSIAGEFSPSPIR